MSICKSPWGWTYEAEPEPEETEAPQTESSKIMNTLRKELDLKNMLQDQTLTLQVVRDCIANQQVMDKERMADEAEVQQLKEIAARMESADAGMRAVNTELITKTAEVEQAEAKLQARQGLCKAADEQIAQISKETNAQDKKIEQKQEELQIPEATKQAQLEKAKGTCATDEILKRTLTLRAKQREN